MADDAYGKIEWLVTVIPNDADAVAEVYDGAGNIMMQKPLPCKPPVNCQFVIDDVPVGWRKAGLFFGGNRYYYAEGESEITTPNDLQNASDIEVTENSTPFLEFTANGS